MELELWIDVVCPWCYLGKRRLDAALERFEARDQVALTVRSFELDPTAPAVREGSVAEQLAAKYGSSLAEIEARQAQLAELGREVGIDFRFDRSVSGNTFDAHRLLHLAAERGLGDALGERLMRGYFSEGLPIGEREALIAAAAEAGLDADAARAALAGDGFADAVRADEQAAAAIGVQGVPFLVLDRRYAVSGAQPIDAYLQALEHAWGEHTAAA